MPTEASGDGRTDAASTVEPGVTAEGTDPTAAVVGEQHARTAAAEPTVQDQDAGIPSAWNTPGSAWDAPGPTDAGAAEVAASVPRQAASDDTEAADEAVHADEPGESNETADSDGAEAEEPDEVVAGHEDYGDDGDYDHHEDHDHDGDYDHHEDHDHDGDYTEYHEYGLEGAAEPRRAPHRPRMLLALVFVVLGAAIVGGAIAIVGSLTHGFKKPVKVTYTKSAVFSLKTGDCFDPQGQSYTLIPCDSPHDAEVFATFTLSGTKWPGTAIVAQEASHGCTSRLTGYLDPQLAISLASTYVYPDSVAWRAGAKTVICEVRAASGQLTGSVRGASATAG